MDSPSTKAPARSHGAELSCRASGRSSRFPSSPRGCRSRSRSALLPRGLGLWPPSPSTWVSSGGTDPTPPPSIPREVPPGRSIHGNIVLPLSRHPCPHGNAGWCPGPCLGRGLGLMSSSSECTLEMESAIFSVLLAILALSNAAFRPQNNNTEVCYCAEPSAAPGRGEKPVFLQGN